MSNPNFPDDFAPDIPPEDDSEFKVSNPTRKRKKSSNQNESVQRQRFRKDLRKRRKRTFFAIMMVLTWASGAVAAIIVAQWILSKS